MARIAIVGPGAIGGVMAAWLSHAGHELVLCSRRPLDELVVKTPDRTITIRPQVFTNPADARPVDSVLVATKTYDAAGTAQWLERLVGQHTPVAILQNGVEHRERFAPWVPAAKIVPVLVYCPAERTAPTVMRQRRKSWLIVADDAPGQVFAGLFADTAIEVRLTRNFRSAAWEKLCVNVAGALNAILLEPARIFRDDQIVSVAGDLVRECIAVGRAEGAVLDDSMIERVLQLYRGNPPDTVNSLQADRAAGRPMEVDARNGVIVRLGRKHGIPTPLNALVVSLLNGLANLNSGVRKP